MEHGTADLDGISVQEWLQVAFIHAIDTGILHLDVPVVYGGQSFNVHMCIDSVGPSPSLDDAMSNTQ
jgi:hypothetical protein